EVVVGLVGLGTAARRRRAVGLTQMPGNTDTVLGVRRIDLAARDLTRVHRARRRTARARRRGRAQARRRAAALVALIGGTGRPRVRGLAVPRQTPRLRAEVVVGLVGLGTAARRRRAVGLTQMPGNTDTVLPYTPLFRSARDLTRVHRARRRTARARGRGRAQTRRRAAALVALIGG